MLIEFGKPLYFTNQQLSRLKDYLIEVI